MLINIKKLQPHAMIPTKATDGSVGFDLYAIDYAYDLDNDFHEYGTGLIVEIPKGYVGLLFPRSSITKTGYVLGNSVGILDQDYRGEVKFRFKEINPHLEKYEAGHRIGQLLITPCVNDLNFIETSFDDTERGSGGFGSSGD